MLALRTFMLGVAVMVTMGVLNHYHAFRRFEFTISDLRMYWHPSKKTSGAIAIAAIDDKSIAELGQWPFRRSVMAQFERELTEYKAAVIGYDVLFSEPDNFDVARASLVERLEKSGTPKASAEQLLGESNDQAFANAIKAHGNTILGYSLGTLEANGVAKGEIRAGIYHRYDFPAPLSYNVAKIPPRAGARIVRFKMVSAADPDSQSGCAQHRFRSIDSDGDGVMRAQMMVARFHMAIASRFRSQYCKALAGDANLNHRLRQHGRSESHHPKTPMGVKLQFPINEYGQMLVNFRGPEGTFPHISFTDILNSAFLPADLQGKMVLVGMTARGEGDRFNTPIGGDFPGVEIHANAIDNIVTNDVIVRSANDTVERVIAVCCSVC